MGTIGIVTDSHSSITQHQAQELGILVLPMPFFIDGECYYEEVTLSREEFFKKLDSGAEVTTSQPSPESVTGLWDQALKKYDQILYFPISSGLSGSCSTAVALAQDDAYVDKVFVVDNGRVSTPMHRSILDALELIEEGYSAREIKEILERSKSDMVIYIAVDTLTYLKKGGRIKPSVAAIGSVLNIKPVLKLDVETLDSFKVCRGMKKARKTMIETVKQDLDTGFKDQYSRGEVTLLAASSSSLEETMDWVREIEDAFPDMKVMCDDLSLGVSCHVGYGGLGIGVSCKPVRKA